MGAEVGQQGDDVRDVPFPPTTVRWRVLALLLAYSCLAGVCLWLWIDPEQR